MARKKVPEGPEASVRAPGAARPKPRPKPRPQPLPPSLADDLPLATGQGLKLVTNAGAALAGDLRKTGAK